MVQQVAMHSVLQSVLSMPKFTVALCKVNAKLTLASASTGQCPHWLHSTICPVVTRGTGSTVDEGMCGGGQKWAPRKRAHLAMTSQTPMVGSQVQGASIEGSLDWLQSDS